MKKQSLLILLVSIVLLGFIFMTSCETPEPTPTPTETTAPTGDPATKAPETSPTEKPATGTPDTGTPTGKPTETPSGTPGEATGTPTGEPTETETPSTETPATGEKAPAKPGKPISGKVKIGIVMVNEDIGDVVTRFKKLEKEGKVTLVFKKTGLDSKKQEEMAKQVIDAGVDALILNPRDSMVGDKIFKIAQKKNVPVFGVEVPMTDDAVSQIGFYVPSAGKVAAEYLAEQIGKKGKILVLSNDFDPQQKEMAETFKKTIDGMSGMEVKIVAVMGEKKDTKKEIKKALTENKDVAGVFAVNNDISVPAAEMMNNMKMTDKILVGHLGGFEAMKLIAKSKFYKGDVKNNVNNMGKETEKVVMTYLRDGKEVPRHVYLDYYVMDKESLKNVMPIK